MKKYLLSLISLCFCLSLSVTVLADSPAYNLSDIKKELKAYHDSGLYLKDTTAAMVQAKIDLDKKLATVPVAEHKKLAIIYDIDETALWNYPVMAKNDFSATLDQIHAIHAQDRSPVNQPVLDFYNYAKSQGVSQFFITGRSEKYRASTIRNLEFAGYSAWQQLFLAPNDGPRLATAANYKAPIRQKITDEGYDVVLSIGDQCSDFAAATTLPVPANAIALPKICGDKKGSYEDYAIKLPNPYYFVP